MSAPGQPVRSFLRAVHRRLIVVRLMESMGGGLLIGSAAALPLVLIQLYREVPAWPAAILLMIIGALGGMVFALRTWPSQLAAARLADTQLKLADLLSTTVAMQPLHGDPWVASIRAMADARCGELSPSRLILNRWGMRAWGGIGLSTALVLAISLLGSDPQPLRARPTDADAGSAADFPQKSLENSNFRDEAGNSSDPAHRMGSTLADGIEEFAADATSSENAQKLRDGTPQDGGGEGKTSSARVPETVPPAKGSGTAAEGEISSGGGGESSNSANGIDVTPVTGSGNGASTDVPAWESASWPDDQQRAMQAMDDGTIPDAYRDLVREYFRPERP